MFGQEEGGGAESRGEETRGIIGGEGLRGVTARLQREAHGLEKQQVTCTNIDGNRVV